LVAAALLLVALASVGCTDVESGRPTIGPVSYLEVAGVVASEQTGVEGSTGYTGFTFDDGRTYRVPPNVGGARPAVGELLLAGTKPSPWVYYAAPRDPGSWPAGCYGLGQNGYELESTIELDSGLTLEKAPDFSWPARATHQDNRIWGAVLCLDKQGRVFEIVG
jgi:hypothetical protein